MKYLVLALIVLASYAQAEDCNYTKITAIQAQQSDGESVNVLIQVLNGNKAPWKNIGDLKSFQSIAQQALAVEASLLLRFPGSYDCDSDDFISIPVVIRING
jgi:hypothetical protein